jgi:putative SOS response-associated peptidase YedK
MCGRYTNTRRKDEIDDIVDAFKAKLTESVADGFERFNIAPTQQVTAITAPDGEPQAEMLRWWLVPSWQKELRGKYPMFNAKLETIETTRSFKNLITSGRRRCLIVADGWYEWLKAENPKDPKIPMHFRVDDGAVFAFAGLWSKAFIDGAEIRSCTIITRDSSSNRVASSIHQRMPVVLPDLEEQMAWLNPDLGAEVVAMCQALPTGRLAVHAANVAVNKATGIDEGPELLVP